ncbi:MAG: aminodeoxychorismate synthase component I [Spirochaetia bacterium]
MHLTALESFAGKMNRLASEGQAFLFLFDFELEKPFLCPLDQAAEKGVFYSVNGNTNLQNEQNTRLPVMGDVQPVFFECYANAFFCVRKHLEQGETYLLNLTFPTKISLSCTLAEVFTASQAKYKLLFQDEFTLFSPECFVRIQDGHIYSYPMKGTINAAIPDAAKKVLEDKKEEYEHNTIVDLIRNDLSIVAEHVTVPRFRYIDELSTSKGRILQVSSEVRGRLPQNWKNKLGDILVTLLPAGSVSGAPKKRTCRIIRNAEGVPRGYYTGVFGLFDGNTLDSGVNIRYIEKTQEGFCYRSGGGITALSSCMEEYNELIQKVYIPGRQ